MPALKHDVTIEQGADFQREYTVTNKDGTDIAGFSSFELAGQLRNNTGKLAANLTVINTGVKTILVSLTSDQTETLPASSVYSHKYDIEGISPQGITYRFAQVRCIISAEQTKPTV